MAWLPPDGEEGLSAEEIRTKEMLPSLLAFRRSAAKRSSKRGASPSHEELERTTSWNSGALRAGIFGVNDGLVSNVSLIMGVAGAGVENRIVLIAGLAGLLAGAFSMAAGEYISMRAQREVFERLITLESHELQLYPEIERQELATIYASKGIPSELAEQVATGLMADHAVALDTHAREELGLDPDEGLGSPWAASGSSFLMFAIGAAVPLAPYLVGSGTAALAWSGGLSVLTLAGVGAAIAILTGKSLLRSAGRQGTVGVLAAAITYGVGSLLGVSVAG